jgi:hypothetical protein
MTVPSEMPIFCALSPERWHTAHYRFQTAPTYKYIQIFALPLFLTPKEFAILGMFLKQPNRVLAENKFHREIVKGILIIAHMFVCFYDRVYVPFIWKQ